MASFERFVRLISCLFATLGMLFTTPARAQAVGAFPPLDTAAEPAAAGPPAGADALAPPASAHDSRYPRVAPSAPVLVDSSAAVINQPSTPPPGGFFPPLLPYREGAPVPQNYRIEQHPNRGLRTGGLVTWGIGYVVGLGFAASNDFDEGTGWLALPVLGPWLALGSREVNCNKKSIDSDCAEEALHEAQSITLITLDGLVQSVGAVMFVIGATSRRSELVRTDVVEVHVRPRSFGARSAGVAATAVF